MQDIVTRQGSTDHIDHEVRIPREMGDKRGVLAALAHPNDAELANLKAVLLAHVIQSRNSVGCQIFIAAGPPIAAGLFRTAFVR